MKIYVVTSGQYSDYHIDGVFENLEKAKKIAYDKLAEYKAKKQGVC